MNILDTLFHDAAQVASNKEVTVNIAIVASHLGVTLPNVTYAEGILYYHPAHVNGMFLLKGTFASKRGSELKQYFNYQRGSGSPLPGSGPPFDPAHTDPVSVTITQPAAISSGSYSMTVHFPKVNTTYTIDTLKSDDDSEVLYGSFGASFVTVILSQKVSVSP